MMTELPFAIAVGLMLAASPAEAHAILMDSQPASGATVQAGPIHIVLRFNSRIDQGRSRLELRGPGLSPVAVPLVPSSSDTLVADTPLAAGRWILRWQVLATDGHITRGDVPLMVQAATPAR